MPEELEVPLSVTCSQPKLTPRSWRLPILLLMAVGVSGDLTVNCRNLAAAFRAVVWEATPLWLGIIAAAPAGGYILGLMIFGRSSDRIGRRWAVTIGEAIAIASVAGLYFSTRVWHLALFSAIFGFSGGFLWPTLSAWFSDLSGDDPRRLNRMLGNFNLAWSSGMVAGALLGGILYQLLGGGTFLVLMVVLGAVLTGVQFVPERTASSVRPENGEIGRADSPRFLLVARLGNGLGWFAGGTLLTILPKLTQVLGISESATGLALAGFYAAVLMLIWLARCSHRWQYRRWPLVLPVPMAILGMGLMLVARTTAVFTLACYLTGIAMALSVVAALYYALHGRQEKRAAATSIHEIVVGLGGVSGSVISGLVAQRLTATYPAELALRGAFVVVIGVAVLIGVAQIVAWRSMSSRLQAPGKFAPAPGQSPG